MVAPLVIGAARVVAQKAVANAARSRVERAAVLASEKSIGGRFEEKLSLAARAKQHTKEEDIDQSVPPEKLFSRTTGRTPRIRISTQSKDSVLSSTQKVYGLFNLVKRLRILWPLLTSVTSFACIVLLVGLAVYMLGDNIITNIATTVVSTITFSEFNLQVIGMFCIMLAFTILIIEALLVFVYLMFTKRS